jgi:hypothetical protein
MFNMEDEPETRCASSAIVPPLTPSTPTTTTEKSRGAQEAISINSTTDLYVPLANDDIPATNGSNLTAYGAAWNVGKGQAAKKELSPRASPSMAKQDVTVSPGEALARREEAIEPLERNYSRDVLPGSGRTVLRGVNEWMRMLGVFVLHYVFFVLVFRFMFRLVFSLFFFYLFSFFLFVCLFV